MFLSLMLPETGRHPGFTNDERYHAWEQAVYDDLDFLYEGDYFECYDECQGKAPNTLTNEQVRGCITFLLRQMRNQYAPYPCIVSGELHDLLTHWIELNEKEDAE